jgi:large subunit ribosomal protein L25
MSENNKKLVAQKRSVVGKQVKQLRRQGQTPAVVYGKHEPVSIQLETHSTSLILRDADSNDLLTVDIDGDERLVLVRDVQRHITRHELMHIDFYEVSAGETITVDVNLVTINEAMVEEAGSATQLLYTVSIEAIPSKLISEIEVDLSLIKSVNDVISVGDLVVPEGVTILTEAEIAVAKFDTPRAVEEEAVEEVDGLAGDYYAEVAVVGEDDDDDEI